MIDSKIFILSFLVFLSSAVFSQQKLKTEANADIVEYTNREGLPTTNITNGIQTKDGFIWISSVEGTYRFNGYEFEEVGADIGLPTMQNMYYDSTKNVMYFASPAKFITFDGKEFKVYTEKEGYKINGLEGQFITFVKADSKDRIWIGSTTPDVYKRQAAFCKFIPTDSSILLNAPFLNKATYDPSRVWVLRPAELNMRSP